MREMIFALYIQAGKKTKKQPDGIGHLSLDKGLALFSEGIKVIDVLQRAQVSVIGAHGIAITGFKSMGLDREGREKFRFSEWWCVYQKCNIDALEGR